MSPEADRFLPVSPRDYLILLSLASEPRHGYAVIFDVEEQSEGRVRLDPANLYRALKRLLRDRLIEETDAPPGSDSSDPRRRYYRMTELGTAVVREEARRLEALTVLARRARILESGESTT